MRLKINIWASSRVLAALSSFFLFNLALCEAQTPSLQITHSSALSSDQNSNGEVNDGDTIRYTVNVQNVGTPVAHNVHIELALDPNTTLVPGSLNVQPFATPDVALITEDAAPNTVSGSFLPNDAGADTGEVLNVVAVNGSTTPGTVVLAYGSLTWSADGNYTYALNNGSLNVDGLSNGQTLTESVSYSINDGRGPVDSSTLMVRIFGNDDPPAAINDQYVTYNNATITVDAAHGLLANDFDPEQSGLSIVGSSNLTPATGSVSVNSDGSFSFTPTMTTGQTHTFQYTVQDGTGAQSSASAVLTATGRILYVNNTNNLTGTGTLVDPFRSLSFALAGSQNEDTVYIFRGDGTSAGLSGSFTIGSENMRIIGQGSELVLNGTTQIASASAPVLAIGISASHYFSVTNHSFTLEGVTIDGATTPSAEALTVAFSDVVTRDLKLFRVTTSNCERTVTVTATGGGTKNVNIGQLQTASLNSVAVSVSYENNTTGEVRLQNSQFNNVPAAISLNSHDTALITGTLAGNTITSNTGPFSVLAFTQNAGSIVLDIIQGNVITNNDTGVAIDRSGSGPVTVNISPSPTPANNISNNQIGVCSQGGATLTINPPSQVNGNVTDFTTTGCALG